MQLTRETMLSSCRFQCGKIVIYWHLIPKTFVPFDCYTMIKCVYMYLFRFLIQRFPFDFKNPIGYTIDMTLQYMLALCIEFFIACMTSFTIGSHLMLTSLTKDIRSNLCSLKGNFKSKTNRINIPKQLTDSVQLHLSIKQSSKTHFPAILMIFLSFFFKSSLHITITDNIYLRWVSPWFFRNFSNNICDSFFMGMTTTCSSIEWSKRPYFSIQCTLVITRANHQKLLF